MSTDELEKLIAEVELKKLSFNGEFYLEFANGISVRVGHTTDYDYSVWEIESNIEIQERTKEWQKLKKDEEERQFVIEAKRMDILSKFPKNQWAEISKAFRNL